MAPTDFQEASSEQTTDDRKSPETMTEMGTLQSSAGRQTREENVKWLLISLLWSLRLFPSGTQVASWIPSLLYTQ